MHRTYDVIIVGLGAMGSAAAYHIAGRGKSVLGLDQFTPPHTFGSSHGQTRIIREAYFEGPVYVPIVQRAYELWQELENTSGNKLFQQTGGLMIGSSDGILVKGAKASAVQHNLRYEMLSSNEIKKRFPALEPTDEMVAVWEPRAGFLNPDRCIQTHLQAATEEGAILHYEEPVLSWKSEGADIRVTTTKDSYLAGHVLLCAGAWAPVLLKEISLPLKIARQLLFWFEPTTNVDAFSPEHLPIFMIEFDQGRIFYGFPNIGEGVKVAIHGEGELTDADHVRRTVEENEAQELRLLTHRFLPDAAGALLKTAVCMYTNTPDGHFLIDQHPKHPQIFIVSPCSGHGFKFSSAIGELLADLLTKGHSRFDLNDFRLSRFQ
jgi:sarcosine oxidase